MPPQALAVPPQALAADPGRRGGRCKPRLGQGADRLGGDLSLRRLGGRDFPWLPIPTILLQPEAGPCPGHSGNESGFRQSGSGRYPSERLHAARVTQGRVTQAESAGRDLRRAAPGGPGPLRWRSLHPSADAKYKPHAAESPEIRGAGRRAEEQGGMLGCVVQRPSRRADEAGSCWGRSGGEDRGPCLIRYGVSL